MIEKICKSLSLNLPGHVLRSKDPRNVLTALFPAWIPLSTAVLVSVIENLPSPAVAQKTRTQELIQTSPGGQAVDKLVQMAMEGLSRSKTKPLVAFVSKMVGIAENLLPENKTRAGATLTADEARELGRKKRAEIARAQAAANGEHPDFAELREVLSDTGLEKDPSKPSNLEQDEPKHEKEHLIGFARLFSGTLEVGDEVYVLPPKFSPANPTAQPEPQKVTITALYLLMGKELESLTSVPPGVVFGIRGLEGHIMKSATLCSQVEGGVNLAGVSMGGEPIVRVALEPENPLDLEKMIFGLRLLEQSDPCAKYEILENGEHVILTAGELHLERCLKDLRERFAHCEIQEGAPIVPYRESIVNATEMSSTKNKDLPRGTVVTADSQRNVHLKLRVVPLPMETIEFLILNASLIKELYEEQVAEEASSVDPHEECDAEHLATIDVVTKRHPHTLRALKELRDGLEKSFHQVKIHDDIWRNVVSNIVGFGPRRVGPNIFIDSTPNKLCQAK